MSGGAARRILMVSYNYPPVGSIGSLRTTKLAKYLPRNGWLPTVLTVARDRTQWSSWDISKGIMPDVKVIRAPFCDIPTFIGRTLERIAPRVFVGGKDDIPGVTGKDSPVLRAARAFVRGPARWGAFPDRYLLWLPGAFALGLRELKRNDYELIYSTSPPVTGHLVAALLNRLTGVPWVADFRDPWVNPYMESTRLRRAADRWLESRTLRTSAATITVSAPLALEASAGAGGGGETACITNGFDPEDYGGLEPSCDSRFVITYTGALFGLKQDPTTLFEVIEELIDEGVVGEDDVLVRFYGPHDRGLVALKERMRYPGILEAKGTVPRVEALVRQCESTALLVLMWDHPYTRKTYGGKLLEYLGARRPVLAWTPSGGILEQLLVKTGAGAAVSSREALKRVLTSWLDEFARTGRLAYRGKEEELERYGWDKLSGRFADLFDQVAGR